MIDHSNIKAMQINNNKNFQINKMAGKTTTTKTEAVTKSEQLKKGKEKSHKQILIVQSR